MTKKIYLKAEGRFATDRFLARLSPIVGEQTFFYPAKNKPDLNVTIFPGKTPYEDRIEATCQAEVSDEVFDAINMGLTKHKLPNNLREDMQILFDQINDWTNEVLRYLKYSLHFTELSESPFAPRVDGEFWSIDGSNWNSYSPHLRFQGTIGIREASSEMAVPLDAQTAPLVQDYIDNGYSPFSSLTFLHRAINEGHNPRYKWIYAAAAAELAIKEFLIEYTYKDGCSPIEPLLLELPSPSLRKLYGQILDYYLGERSPCVSKIHDGSERRNELLHRPIGKEKRQTAVTSQEATQYVREIELAIFHLLHNLYPKDWIIERLFQNIEQVVGEDCGKKKTK
jgi:hypothetical protein